MALSLDQQATVDQLKLKIGATTKTDEELWLIFEAAGSLNTAAADIWEEKAAGYAELIDTKEGSSTRNLGDLYEQALKMAGHYRGLALVEATSARRSRTRPIERP